MNVAKLSAIANRLLDLAAEVEGGITYVGFDTLVQISQDISAAIEDKGTKPVDSWAHLKGMTGNLSPPHSPVCASPKKVSFDLE